MKQINIIDDLLRVVVGRRKSTEVESGVHLIEGQFGLHLGLEIDTNKKVVTIKRAKDIDRIYIMQNAEHLGYEVRYA